MNDDGPGVPEDVQPRIFDPFFTTKEVGKGTGLGLTVAYAIVQEHGGRITREVGAGRGASFFVELPVGDGAGQAGAAAGAGARADVGGRVGGAGGRGRSGARRGGRRVAGRRRASSWIAPATARRRSQRVQARAYDLIICDLKMPRVDGMQFYRDARARRSPTLARRILFVTGDVAGTEAERFLEETGCRWLAKPFRLRRISCGPRRRSWPEGLQPSATQADSELSAAVRAYVRAAAQPCGWHRAHDASRAFARWRGL